MDLQWNIGTRVFLPCGCDCRASERAIRNSCDGHCRRRSVTEHCSGGPTRRDLSFSKGALTGIWKLICPRFYPLSIVGEEEFVIENAISFLRDRRRRFVLQLCNSPQDLRRLST